MDINNSLSSKEVNSIIEVDDTLTNIEEDSTLNETYDVQDDGVIKPKEKEKKSFFQKITDISNIINRLSEYISVLSGLIEKVILFPSMYIDYYLNKINILNLTIQKQLLKLLKLKNKLLINIINLLGSGSTKDTNKFPVFDVITGMINGIEILTVAFITAFNGLITTLLGNPLMALMPESMNFGLTPKSLKFVTQIPVLTPSQSITDAIMSDKVDLFIDSLDIQEKEGSNTFFLENFNSLIKASNSVKDNVLNGIRAFGLTLCYTQEPLPKYEDLSITNLQFCSYILNSWGPTGKTCFGIIGYP